MDESQEPAEQIVVAEQALYKLGEEGQGESGFQSFLRAVTAAVDVANNAYKREGGLAGISTGLIDMDKKLGGLHKSDLLILAGRPSMGKTSLATNVAFNIAKAYQKGQLADGTEGTLNGGVVGFFSLEMSAEQLAARILSEASEVPSEQIRRGDMTETEFRRFVDAAKTLESCPLFIDDTPALPISQLAARARRLKRTHGLDVLIIDYLQLVRPASAKDSRVNEVSEITQGLKAIAKELDIPVIALSQLSRQVENRDDKRPQLADLRESGSIEQDADLVLCEDTRVTRKLTTRFGIETRLMALHDHNEQQMVESVLKRLLDGQKIALVSRATRSPDADSPPTRIAGVLPR